MSHSNPPTGASGGPGSASASAAPARGYYSLKRSVQTAFNGEHNYLVVD